MSNYSFKIATPEEVSKQFDYWISVDPDEKENWVKWKAQEVQNATEGKMIPYYGLLDGEIICEAYARICSEDFKDPEGIVEENNIAYLFAFRVKKKYEGQHYFSKLFDYMINDLKNKGYQKVTLAVETTDERNLSIYKHKGFNELIKVDKDIFPDGQTIEVEYRGRSI